MSDRFILRGVDSVNLPDSDGWGIRLTFSDTDEAVCRVVAFRLGEGLYVDEVAAILGRSAKTILSEFEATNQSPKGTEGEDTGTREDK